MFRNFKSRPLKDAFFEVALEPLYVKEEKKTLDLFGYCKDSITEYREATKIKPRENQNKIGIKPQNADFFAVKDLETGNIFSAVTSSYQLTTNKEAFEGAKEILETVFRSLKFKDFECFNVGMPASRSYCFIDLMAKEAYEIANDSRRDFWSPFIRIVNSYNRTYKLSYQVGFCRSICKNSVIFGAKSVTLSTAHSKMSSDLVKAAHNGIGDIRDLEARLLLLNKNLERYYVPEAEMLPLFCKIFNVSVKERNELSERMIQGYISMRDSFKRVVKDYFDDMGPSGYAALNVLSDIATYPISRGFLSSPSIIHSRQIAVGEWMNDFTQKIKSESFSFKEYIGKDAYEMADRLIAM